MKCDVAEIWKKHKRKLFNFIKKRIRDNDASEELLHVVLLKVCTYCSNRSDVRNVPAWLYQIASNTIADYAKKNSRFTLLNHDIEDSHCIDPKHDAINWLEYFIKLLPERYSVPLILCDINGMDQKSVADQIKLSLPAIKSRILRGRRLLKTEIQKCGIIEFNDSENISFTPIKPCCATFFK
jgi:RNA polymerase sigma-70 factor (ECF subfamily)